MSNQPRILICDDDIDLVKLLSDYLSLEGFCVTAAHRGAQALAEMKKQAFDLLVLDVMMPEMNGIEVLSKIRETSSMPVLMLTAKGDPIDRILGLELGADDYVPKPCPPRELVARMRAILRRSATQEKPRNNEVKAGDLKIDLSRRLVSYQDTPIAFTGTELSLLELLARRAGQIVNKEELYTQVLSRPMGRYDRAIDVHVSSIRQKLAPHVQGKIHIDSIRGVGYQLIID